MKRQLRAFTPRPKSDGDGTWWHRVGSAHENDKGQVFIWLDSVPVPDVDGKVVIALFEPQEDEPGKAKPKNTRTRANKPVAAQELDDEIPF